MENAWQQFLTVLSGTWQSNYLGGSLYDWMLALVVFVTVMALRSTLVSMFMWNIRRIVDSTKNPFDNTLLENLKGPVTFIPAVLAYSLGLFFLDLEDGAKEFATKITHSLILINVFWLLHGLVQPLHFLFKFLENSFNTTLRLWVMKLIQVVIGLTSVATVLEVWGVQIAPILTGLGLLGMAVALAAQDMFRNLLSGMMILSERRFVRGDWVCVEGVVEGTVENIGFRSTLVRRFDNAPVYVPNSEFSETAVINYSGMNARRIYWTIGLEYKSTAKQLKNIRTDIEKWLISDDRFITDGSVTFHVRLDKFNDSSVDLMVYCFTKTTKWGDWLQAKEDLLLSIKEIVEDKHKSGFAFPSMSIYKENF